MQRKLEILMLEDVECDAMLVERALRSGGIDFRVRRVETREDFLHALADQHPDVILADCKLPHFDGRTALRLASEIRPQAPVIIVTGTLLDEAAVEPPREGAVDDVLKDRLSRLAPAVRNALEVAQERISRRDAEEKYRALFTQARDGIMLAEFDGGRIVDANPEFERLVARPLAELRELRVRELLPPAGVEAAEGRLLESREDAEENENRIEIGRPDGTRVTVEFRVSAIELQGRRYLLGLARDINDRLLRERRLHDQLDELRRFQRVTVDRELRLEELEERLVKLTTENAAGGP